MSSKFILLAALLSAQLFGATYYIDFVGGSDSNNGTSKETPWKRAPGMTGTVNGVGPGAIDDAAGSSCGSTPCSLPGTQFIFKGGVTWDYTVLRWTIRQTGTGFGANTVYFGVDQTWYTGASWSRPIFNFGGASYNPCAAPIIHAPVSYVVVDNFEFTNLYWDCPAGTPNGAESYMNMGGSTHYELKNLYMHGWSHAPYGAGANPDVCNLIGGDTQGLDTDSSVHDSLFDGTDTARDACVAIWGGPANAYNNVFRYVPNGAIVVFPKSWHDNLFEYITTSYDTTQHNQAFESNNGNDFYFYNNVIRHTTECQGLTVWIAVNPNYTFYAWNNVIYDTNDAPFLVAEVCPTCSTGNAVVENNTIQCGAGANPTAACLGCPSLYQSCTFKNNHLITNAASAITPCGANCTTGTNLIQTLSAATAQGYSISSTYSLSPTVNGGTVGAGTNLSAACSGPLASLCNDTTYATLRTAVARGATWDIGAYEYAAVETPSPLHRLTGGRIRGGTIR